MPPFSFGWNLPTAAIGAGLIGDIGGAISNWQQQQRLRNIYKDLRDPGKMAAAGEAYAQPLFERQAPQLGRMAAAQLGQTGTYAGAYGRQFQEQVLAKLWADLYGQGSRNYIDRLRSAAGATGTPSGTSGATGKVLQTLMMMSMMRGGGATPQGTAQPTGSQPFQSSYGGWGSNLDLGVPTDLSVPAPQGPYYSQPYL